jgi:hypothetical protein
MKGVTPEDSIVIVSSMGFDQEEFETKDGYFFISKNPEIVNGIRALINKY